MTKISIITPCYNSSRTICKTMDSVLEQTVLPYEYIIKDGGSVDQTLLLLEKYKEKFTRKNVRFIVISEPDDGIYDALNKGIDVAEGDLIGILNSDDWLEPIAVQRITEEYEKDPFDYFYADLRIWSEEEDKGLREKFIKKARFRKHLAVSRDWNHPTTYITKDMYDIYRYKGVGLHDDWELILRLRNDNRKVRIHNETLANFRLTGISHKRSLKGALSRVRDRYRSYRDNGYSRLYFLECVMMEVAKFIAG